MRTLIFAAALVSLARAASSQTPDCRLVAGWQQQGEARRHEPDNLFDYMNGNAEGYLVYRFQVLNGVTCKSGGDTILLDIFEMADPEYAYGIFSANRDPRLPIDKIGMGGQVTERRAIFAKGKYYVELAANPAKDHRAALRAFAAEIERRIEGRATPPDLLGWFPREKQIENSVRLVPESVLGIRILKRGYVGQYEFGKAFLVREESAEAAGALMAKLRERLGQTAPLTAGNEGFSGTDKYLDGLCIFRKGSYIGGFANLKGGRDASAEARAFAAAIP